MTYPIVSYDILSLTPYQSCTYGAEPRYDEGMVDLDGTALYAATKIRFYDGDYDRGGAYWGSGNEPIYCVHTTETDEVQQFVRAVSPDAAFEQLEIPMHLRVAVAESCLYFDREGGMVDVSPILELFDEANLYAENYIGRYGTGQEAWARAQAEVQDWVFTPRLYRLIRLWWRATNSDHDGAETSELDCRALVLQWVAGDYRTLENYADSYVADDDEDSDQGFSSPLDLLRSVEWTDERECPIDYSPADEGPAIYYCFDS